MAHVKLTSSDNYLYSLTEEFTRLVIAHLIPLTRSTLNNSITKPSMRPFNILIVALWGAVALATASNDDIVYEDPGESMTLEDKASFPPGLEWMRGRGVAVAELVFSGEIDVNSLPPPSEEWEYVRQFHSDMIFAQSGPVPVTEDGPEAESDKTTYKNVFGEEVTEEEYEVYLASKAKREKPFMGQIPCPARDASENARSGKTLPSAGGAKLSQI